MVNKSLLKMATIHMSGYFIHKKGNKIYNMTVKDKHTAATNILEGATKHKYKSTVIHS